MENTIHTSEELKQLYIDTKLSYELKDLAHKFNNEEVLGLYNALQCKLNKEIAKYNVFIGKEYSIPPSTFSDNKERRKGIIKSFEHFNSNTIICKIEYTEAKYMGFDNHNFKALTII